MELFEDAVVTPCSHVFCSECILQTLLTQSMCPLCRGNVYMDALLTVEEHPEIEVKRFFKRLSLLQVECPSCKWLGLFRDWKPHITSKLCLARQQCPSGAKQKALLQQLNLDKERLGQPDHLTNGTEKLAHWLLQERPGSLRRLMVVRHRMENVAGAIGGYFLKNVGLHHTQIILELKGSPSVFPSYISDELLSIASLPVSVAPFPVFRTIYLSLELMADREGLVWTASNVFPQLKPSAIDIAVFEHSEGPQSGLQDGETTPAEGQDPTAASGGETNVAENNGVDAGQQPCGSSSDSHLESMPTREVADTDLVDYLISIREKTYSILNWNCHDVARDIKRLMNVHGPPSRMIPVPRPVSFSCSLMVFLAHMQKCGKPPVLESTRRPLNSREETSGNCTGETPRGFRKFLLPFKFWNASVNPSQTTGSSTTQNESLINNISSNSEIDWDDLGNEVSIKSVAICLYPAEDLNRKSLKTAAQFMASTKRFLRAALDTASTLGGTTDIGYSPEMTILPHVEQPYSTNSSATTSADAESSPLCNRSTLSPCQIRLRFDTLPVVLLELQAVKSSVDSSSSCRPSSRLIGYLSVEFRSDAGLSWHFYLNRPPGLGATPAAGGTDYVVSAGTHFGLETFLGFLETVKWKEYHPTKWSSWDFVEHLLLHCCEQEAQYLLEWPIHTFPNEGQNPDEEQK